MIPNEKTRIAFQVTPTIFHGDSTNPTPILTHSLWMIPSFNIQCFIAFIFVFAINNDTHFLNLDTLIDDTGECLDKTCITSQIKHSKTKWKDKQWHVWPGWGKEKLWKTVLKIQLQDQQCPNDSGHACKWVWQLHLLVITI